MSLIVDDREDPSLVSHLERFGLPLAVARLDYGDIAIRSCDGRLIGYERKRLTDLINSMKDRRLSGLQLKGMYGLYDRIELIVESIWRVGDGGAIEVPNGRGGSWQPLYHLRSGISYRQIDSYLYSQYELCGVPCWRTGTTSETAALIASRWHWWQKDYVMHKSHDVIYTNNPSAQRRGAVTVSHGAPDPVTLMAAQIPGIDAKAWDVSKYFASPEQMCLADVAEWCRVPWTDRKGNVRHFSRESATNIVKWLRGQQ